MRFLIAFVALIGYASASAIISPLLLGANAGDVQAAAIDASVAAQDHVRAVGENQARAAEAVLQHNTEAVRAVAEANRDIHENTYWNGVAASQNLVAAAQSQAAAIDGVAAGVRAASLGHPLAYAAAPLGWAGAVAPIGLGVHGLGVHGLGVHGLGVHGLGLRAW